MVPMVSIQLTRADGSESVIVHVEGNRCLSAARKLSRLSAEGVELVMWEHGHLLSGEWATSRWQLCM